MVSFPRNLPIFRTPKEIESVLETLHAKTSSDFYSAGRTICWIEDECPNYLGSYFPRSYAEARCVFEDKTELLKKSFSFNKEINILDIGSGPGACSLAILKLLREILPDIKINIYAIDGNEYFQNYFSVILETLDDKNCFLQQHNYIFEDFNNLEIELTQINHSCFNNARYDVIICSKFINEFIRFYSDKENTVINSETIESLFLYKQICAFSEKHLNNNGFFYLSDVTDCFNTTDVPVYHFNVLMNKELQLFLKEKNTTDFTIISPKPCFLWWDSCENAHTCFSQIILECTFFNKTQKSKFSYKLFYKGIHKNDNHFLQPKLFQINASSNFSQNNHCCKGVLRKYPNSLNPKEIDYITMKKLQDADIISLSNERKINVDILQEMIATNSFNFSEDILKILIGACFEVSDDIL